MAGRPRELYAKGKLTDIELENRANAMANIGAFIALVAPYRAIGHCHLKLLNFFCQDAPDQLALLPRGHQKSTMLAFWCVWHIVNHPETTILYASVTTGVATAQLSFMKKIMTSKVFRKYWPELVNENVMQREKWTNDEIAVDHWRRQEFGIRDMTIQTAGIGSTITGLHYDVVALDDLVVLENSQTPAERAKVATWFSLLNSIINTDAITKAVGTRYHPKDLYSEMIDMQVDVFDDEGSVIDVEPVFSVMQEVVEIDGEFLWPRQLIVQAGKHVWYGFDRKELARIKVKYIDKMQFYAQYYNDPNDPENRHHFDFIYYKKENLRWDGKYWSVNGKRLNVYSAIDFASTVTKKADYTAIVVIGIDSDRNIFVLAIDRFKTDKISEMQTRLATMYSKWKWLKLLAEVDGQQNLVVEDIRERNIATGVYYSIEKIKHSDDKALRTWSILEPRYAAGQIYHYLGGNCQVLEDELTMPKPPNDDVRDAMAGAVSISQAPSNRSNVVSTESTITYNPKYGGVA